MRRWARRAGTVMLVLGVLTGLWVLVVWRWKDPFTSIYTLWEQHKLEDRYNDAKQAWRRDGSATELASVRADLAAEAARYRRSTHRGEPIGRITVPRMGVNMILVDGTDDASLRKGPGRDLRTFMPGQGQLVYIAGNRTTYLAPFSHIEQMRRGDSITLEVPYATFRYVVTGWTIVRADDVARLRSHGREVVTLQACHPRFFATQRYLVYGQPVSVELPDGRTYRYARRGIKLESTRASRQASPQTVAASRSW
jgi:sortase A